MLTMKQARITVAWEFAYAEAIKDGSEKRVARNAARKQWVKASAIEDYFRVTEGRILYRKQDYVDKDSYFYLLMQDTDEFPAPHCVHWSKLPELRNVVFATSSREADEVIAEFPIAAKWAAERPPVVPAAA